VLTNKQENYKSCSTIYNSIVKLTRQHPGHGIKTDQTTSWSWDKNKMCE